MILNAGDRRVVKRDTGREGKSREGGGAVAPGHAPVWTCPALCDTLVPCLRKPRSRDRLWLQYVLIANEHVRLGSACPPNPTTSTVLPLRMPQPPPP